jgi:hypothetical protein
MKKYAIMWILLLTLMLGSIHSVIAVQDNGDGGIKPYGVPGFVTTYEVPMEINCTWSHGSPSLQILFWSDSNTLAPLPNSGWGDQILSINVGTAKMYVDIVVTDVWAKGDYFEVWEVDGVSPTSGHLIGTTPQVPISGSTTTQPDVAFADPTYSHGSFRVLLQSGTHYFAFREVGHNWGGGAFYVKFCYTSAPIGGTLMPVDTLVAGTPYFALVGVVGVVLIVAAVKKRRF